MIGRNDVTGPRDVKIESHTFQDHHGDVRSRQLRARRDRMPRRRTVSCFLAFFGLFPGLSVSHCFFLSFFLSFFEIERFQFPFLVSLLFFFLIFFFNLCSPVHGHFCSVVVGFSISHCSPLFPLLNMSSPQKNTQA